MACWAIGSEMAGMPHSWTAAYEKNFQRLSNQSSTSGLSLVVRYSVVPMRGVGSAVMGEDDVPILEEGAEGAPCC